jgi:hypothetical protein
MSELKKAILGVILIAGVFITLALILNALQGTL